MSVVYDGAANHIGIALYMVCWMLQIIRFMRNGVFFELAMDKNASVVMGRNVCAGILDYY